MTLQSKSVDWFLYDDPILKHENSSPFKAIDFNLADKFERKEITFWKLVF